MKGRNRKIIYVLVLIVVFSISVGYAALNKTLTITGNSEVKENSWNVYFEHIYVSDWVPNSVVRNANIDNNTGVIDFEIILNLPGEKYVFFVDIVNDGTIDAKIDNIEKTILTEEQLKYLTYTVKYEDGKEIEKNQVIQKKSNVTLKIEVKYRYDVDGEDLPTTYQTLDLFFKVNFVQADSSDSNKVGINYYDFKIENVTYQYDEGMIWANWVSSKYEKNGLSTNYNGNVCAGDNDNSFCIRDSNGTLVKSSDKIIFNGEYFKGSCGGVAEPS